MLVEPRALVRRLTPTATRLLEASVGRASNSRAYEIVVEHLLSTMLEDEKGDAARLLHQHEVDRNRLLAHVERVLNGLRTGNAGRPVFSESLFQWIEDAWVVASVDWARCASAPGSCSCSWCSVRESTPRRPTRSWRSLEGGAAQLAGGRARPGRGDRGVPAARRGAVAPGPSRSTGKPGGAPKPCRSSPPTSPSGHATGSIDPIFGRDREIRQVIDILARRRKNNPIIVGEPGVGKTALVEGLALGHRRGRRPGVAEERRALAGSTSACSRPARA